MAPPLLSLRDVTLTFGGHPLFDGVSLDLGRGDRVCLVGRNGSGKSTLLKVVAGLVDADDGERFLQPGTFAAYLPQEPDLSGCATVADFVAGGLPHGERDEDHRADILLAEVGLDPAAAPTALSGGEARRAALARVLVGRPDLLLLDEPTNHLDLGAIAWLETTLRAYGGALMVVSHDRRLLETVTNTTVWLDRGRVRRLDKGYADFEAWVATEIEREAQERHKLDRLIAQETVWSHQGISARRTRNMGRLRRLHELRAERTHRLDPTGRVKMEAEVGAQSGRLVVDAENISFAWGEEPVVSGFSTRILRGDRLGIVGPNGSGKTTLLRLLTGELAPQAGRVKLGTNLSRVYLDQTRDSLDASKTLWETLCPQGGDQVTVRGSPRHVVSYLRDFLFDERQARSPVAALSGGERNRLMLMRALARPSNFLVLDEPTNDLDMDTLDLLQDLLADYDGTLLLVSHDRDFLDRVVTSTIALEGGGRVVEYPGGYSDMMRLRSLAGPGDAARPAPAAKRRDGDGAPRPKKAPTKLSYKQQRLLAELPGRLASLEAEVAGLEKALHDPDLYTRDPESFRRSTGRLDAARGELATAEDQWLELEVLREDLEGGRD